MRRFVWFIFVILLTLTALVVLWQFRQAFVLFLLSLVVASSISPLVDNFLDSGLPKWAALVLTYLPLLLVVVLVALAVSGPLLRDIEAASNDISVGYEQLREIWLESESLFQSSLADQMPNPTDLYERLRGDQRGEIFQAVVGATGDVAAFVGNFGIIVILSIYWSADRAHFERLWLSIIPVRRRSHARAVWREIESGIGAYVRSELLQSLLAGIFLWLGFQFMGLPYPMLLAVFGALAWLIPWLGGIIALFPPLLVGLNHDMLLGLLTAAYVLLVLVFLEFFIQPRFLSRRRYSSVLLLVVALVFADAFGLIGIILAPLVSAVIEISVNRILQPALKSEAEEEDIKSMKDKLSGLNHRLTGVSAEIVEREPETSPELLSLLERLEKLVERVEKYLSPDSI